jgi:hypothetical protein
MRFRRVLRDLSTADSRIDSPEHSAELRRQRLGNAIPEGQGLELITDATASRATEVASAMRVDDPLQSLPARLNRLETQLQQMQRPGGRLPSGRLVPEYDPSQAAPEETAEVELPPPQRAWGPEQMVGPPDTEQAGDHPTAWASRDPDGGPEWLQAGFDHPVDLVEVRIRESFNPGAISKVTAMVNGQEVVLWEGVEARGQAPRDFLVRVEQNIRADSIMVHMDTTRVQGWNEIDAIELIGRDGSRQWATSAEASSTFAERRPPEAQIGFDFIPPVRRTLTR